jgi:hypothetical protein
MVSDRVTKLLNLNPTIFPPLEVTKMRDIEQKINPGRLAGFIGTVNWYKHMLPGVVLTDGAQYLSANGAGWLIDAIASYQTIKFRDAHPFQVWTLSVNDEQAALHMQDDEEGEFVVSQDIPYTDFPIHDFTLYASYNGEQLVIMLTSEY